MQNFNEIRICAEYPTYGVSRAGDVINLKTGKVLKPLSFSNGYVRYSLTKEGKQKDVLGHRLVASLFCERVEGKTFVNHIDGNKRNNRADNLEWCTREENMKHASEHRLVKSGEDHFATKVSENLAIRIALRIKEVRTVGNKGLAKVADEFNVPRHLVYDIATGHSWKNATGHILN